MIYLEFDELDDPVLFLGYAVFCALACFDVFAGSSETLSLTESSSNIHTMHAQSLTLPRARSPSNQLSSYDHGSHDPPTR